MNCLEMDRDLELCHKAYYEYRNNPMAEDGILFKCFNEEETAEVKKIMKGLYPEVPVYFTYLIFIK